MPIVTASKRLEVEPRHVFDLVEDPKNMPLLYPRLTPRTEGAELTLKEGATFRAHYVPLLPSVLEYDPSMTVTEASRPERLVLSADPWLRWEWTIAGTGAGTLVQLEQRLKMIWSGTVGDVLGKVMALRLQADVRSSVEALHRLVERAS